MQYIIKILTFELIWLDMLFDYKIVMQKYFFLLN